MTGLEDDSISSGVGLPSSAPKVFFKRQDLRENKNEIS